MHHQVALGGVEPRAGEKRIAGGCDEYFTKPIDREILFSTITRYMSEEHQPQEEVQAWII